VLFREKQISCPTVSPTFTCAYIQTELIPDVENPVWTSPEQRHLIGLSWEWRSERFEKASLRAQPKIQPILWPTRSVSIDRITVPQAWLLSTFLFYHKTSRILCTTTIVLITVGTDRPNLGNQKPRNTQRSFSARQTLWLRHPKPALYFCRCAPPMFIQCLVQKICRGLKALKRVTRKTFSACVLEISDKNTCAAKLVIGRCTL
jgi:hypothetical protein